MERDRRVKEKHFYERIIRLSKQRKKSMNEIERELGYPRNALHNYKDGKEPSGRRLIEIAHYFGVSPEYLLDGYNSTDYVPIIQFFQSLSEDDKIELCEYCQKWLVNEKIKSSNISSKKYKFRERST